MTIATQPPRLSKPTLILAQCQQLYEQVCATVHLPNLPQIAPPWTHIPKLPIEPGFIYSMKATRRRQANFSPNLPRIDNAVSVNNYTRKLRTLLREEYEALLLLYEGHSRYQQRVTIVEKGHSRTQTQQAETYASLTIPGIYFTNVSTTC